MDTMTENSWLKDPAVSRRRSRDTAERFVAYSRSVLDLIKRDIAAGMKIDPKVVKNLEDTIARHEPASSGDVDVSRSIDRIMKFSGGRRQ
jgi:hypothetical protein